MLEKVLGNDSFGRLTILSMASLNSRGIFVLFEVRVDTVILVKLNPGSMLGIEFGEDENGSCVPQFYKF